MGIFVCFLLLFLVRFGCRVATFWEIADHSVDHMFSLYFDFVLLVISRFGFEGWIWVPIASVPDLCILFTSTKIVGTH